MRISLGRKYLGHPYILLGIISEAPFPLLLVSVEDIIISSIGINCWSITFLCGIHIFPCLLYSVPYHFYVPIFIWKFPVVGNIINITHLYSILIYKIEGVDKASVMY